MEDDGAQVDSVASTGADGADHQISVTIKQEEEEDAENDRLTPSFLHKRLL